jgi:dipeptidyl aminopeptidase/acylaminoacyl peptidase
VSRRGVIELVSIRVPDGEMTTLAQGERHLSKLTVTRDYLAYTSHSPVAPVELFKCAHDGTGESVVSALNTWWQDRILPRFERRTFTVPDGDGGTETIDGWLLRPTDADGPTPLLVDVHGGPASYTLFDYNPTAYWSLLWSQGWTILALNAVGSASYGRDFADRLRGRWGELDMPQYLSAIQTLQDEGVADDRLMLTGKSYGGYLTSWAIGHTDIFQAAVVMAPVTNIETHYGTSDSGFYSDPYAMRVGRRHHRETMRRLSPMQHVEQASTPTLILQGTDDERCPKCQAEELFVTLRRDACCAAELVLYPGASHKFTASGKLSHRKDVMSRIASWAMQWVIEGDPQRPGQEQRTGEQRMKNTAET